MANTLKKIQTITVGSGGSSTIEFTSIPQTYTDLKLVLSVRNSVDSADGVIEFNGSSTNVGSRMIVGDGSNVASYIDTANYFAVSRSSYTASVFGNVEIYIPNYTSANYKSFSIDSAPENNATGTSLRMTWGLWSNSAAITSIKLTPGGSTPTWVQYSTATLYGISNANTTTGGSGKATGGNEVYTDGTYWYHVFKSDGNFVPTTSMNVDYLVVAGGGGGSYGGGGAGGLRCTVGATGGGGSLESQLAVTAQTYAITVGAGGVGGANNTAAGTNGSDSVFSSITSTGGGGGGARTNTTATNNGKNGGAGGGGGADLNGTGTTTTAGTGTANQGFAGGTGRHVSGSFEGSGGGGGAGAVGNNSSSGTGGNGGAGVASSITGTSVTRGGGGAGGGNVSGSAGSGGGGAVNANGTVNTGGGGGGGVPVSTGGAGGSGIVIVRYAA